MSEPPMAMKTVVFAVEFVRLRERCLKAAPHSEINKTVLVEMSLQAVEDLCSGWRHASKTEAVTDD